MLEAKLLERLRRLRLIPSRHLLGELGENPSLRGRGGRQDFSGHQAYVPGMDYRQIDWNVAARHDELYVRENYREERFTLRLSLDTSPSMGDPESTKGAWSRRLVAALGATALLNRHPVELEWSDAPPRRFLGEAGLWQLVEALEAKQLEPGEGSRPAKGSETLSLWVTDGYGPIPAGASDPQSDRIMVLLSDREEISPRLEGNYSLVDVESNEQLSLAIGKREQHLYQERYREFIGQWRQQCHQQKIRFAWLRTDEPLEAALFEVLVRLQILG